MKKIALSLSLLCLGFSGQSQVASTAVDLNNATGIINNNGQQCVLTADGTNPDFRPRPLADNYQNTQYVNRFSQSIWSFDKPTILDHIGQPRTFSGHFRT